MRQRQTGRRSLTNVPNRRFSANAELFSDFACLDPKNFGKIKVNGSALQEISKCLLKFDDRATVGTLHADLSCLAFQWERLKKSPLEGYFVRTGSAMLVGGEEDTGGPLFVEPKVELVNRTCSCCKNCAICVSHPLTVQPSH